ncbi:uncharacterized protein LOC134727932 [Mytilus trossulus]|uniref:uncharacterized protein LOC134727932 n=1 Tax=Mytilus trossulus TaxID=6551 RepID=UPI003006CAE9
MKTFGKVVLDSSACNIPIHNKGNIQAQIIVPPQTNKFDKVSLKFKQTIQTKLTSVRGCTFLPDGKMVLACRSPSNQMKVFNPDGSVDFDLKEIGFVCDVEYVGDNSVAVTYGRKSLKINIIDVQTRKLMKALYVGSSNNGVTFKGGKLIYCAGDQGLNMISLSNESITSITTTKMSSDACVASQGNKLFYTNEDNHNVKCCDIQGKTLWTFKEKRTLSYPMGISVDNGGNVYVAGFSSHNVVVISTDGQRCRQLLSAKDGLHCPSAVVYDRTNNKLLISNYNGSAFVYDAVGE